jgi:hypothetical protein
MLLFSSFSGGFGISDFPPGTLPTLFFSESIMSAIVSSVSVVRPFVLSVINQSIDSRIDAILSGDNGESVLIDTIVNNDGFKYRGFLALFALRGILSAPILLNERGIDIGAKALIKALAVSIHSNSKDATREYCLKVARFVRAAIVNGADVWQAESVQALAVLGGKAKTILNEPSSVEREELALERAETAAIVMQQVEQQKANEAESLRQASVISGLADKLESANRMIQSTGDKLAQSEKARIDADVMACAADEARVSIQVKLDYALSIMTAKQKSDYSAKFAA